MAQPRLPTPGSDNGAWGRILNEFLLTEHNPDGTLKKADDITEAKTVAENALSTAEAAVFTAGTASTGAADAILAANNAQQTANQAVGDSGTAQSVANAAQPKSEKNQASGYPGLDSSSKISYLQLPTGNGVSTVAIGNHTHTASQVGAIASPSNPQKGDLLAYSGSAWTKLPKGLDGQFLTLDANETTGLKWADLPDISGITSLSDLEDVDVLAAQPGDALVRSSDAKWRPMLIETGEPELPPLVPVFARTYSGGSWVDRTIDLSGSLSGDIIFLQLQSGNGNGIPPTPAGFTPLNDGVIDSAGTRCFYKTADGTETSIVIRSFRVAVTGIRNVVPQYVSTTTNPVALLTSPVPGGPVAFDGYELILVTSNTSEIANGPTGYERISTPCVSGTGTATVADVALVYGKWFTAGTQPDLTMTANIRSFGTRIFVGAQTG